MAMLALFGLVCLLFVVVTLLLMIDGDK